MSRLLLAMTVVLSASTIPVKTPTYTASPPFYVDLARKSALQVDSMVPGFQHRIIMAHDFYISEDEDGTISGTWHIAMARQFATYEEARVVAERYHGRIIATVLLEQAEGHK
jgi:hypothetical protein